MFEMTVPPGSPAPESPSVLSVASWQDVATSALLPYVPANGDSLPMPQYAMQTVMAWAQAQGLAGAIPTWEIGSGVWGVILLANHPHLTQITIPLSEMETFDPSDTAMWGQAVMRWAQLPANGYQMAIPTYQSDGETVTALAFGADYPPIVFYDAPNTELFNALQWPRALANLNDPAVWAQSIMRVARNNGYIAGWPTWEWTTFRGMMCMPAYDLGALPEPTKDNVDKVVHALDRTLTMVTNSTNTALSNFSGIYQNFTQSPVADPGLEILTDCVFGAIQIALNAIPVVGGSLAAFVSTAITVAQQAAQNEPGSSAPTLETYQQMLTAAANATTNYISECQQKLVDAAHHPEKLKHVWASRFTNPMNNQPMKMGYLSLIHTDVLRGDEYWTDAQQAATAQLETNLQAAILAQLYFIARRTYPNRTPRENYFYGTLAEVTGPGGKMAQYVVEDDENYSVWYTDFNQVDDYVEATEYWLQSNANSTLPEYAPPSLCQALFSDDGFGDAAGWTGSFSKATVYGTWLMEIAEWGDGGGYFQYWQYGVDGNIVSATIVEDGVGAVAAWTDAYGNFYSDESNSIVSQANQACGFAQPVIVNYLAPLS